MIKTNVYSISFISLLLWIFLSFQVSRCEILENKINGTDTSYIANNNLSQQESVITNDGSIILESLTKSPPSIPMTTARKAALNSLDSWLSRPLSNYDDTVIAYYRSVVDRAIEKIKTEKIKSGVRIFQLYSSSILVQTPETVFAFDLDQGPNRDSDSKHQNQFNLTNEQIKQLASLIDISFHTHEHDDHIDLQLTEALLNAGKTVVTTQSNKILFGEKPWVNQLKVIDQTLENPIQIGPLKVDVLRDHQWDNSLHNHGTPCNAFNVTTPDGVSVMTKGDINCGLRLYGWLCLLKQRGRNIDVFTGSSIYWRGVDVTSEIDNLFSPLWLPGHAWEFGHRRDDQAKGNCAGFLQSWQIVHRSTESEKVQVLTWGDWIDVLPHN